MLFARTRVAEQKLIGMFRDHRVERHYWAVAHGLVQSQTIRSILVRDRGDGLRGSRANMSTDAIQAFVDAAQGAGEGDELSEAEALTSTSLTAGDNKHNDASLVGESLREDGQLAVTHVEFLEQIGQASIVRCRLETGRTHQIRIHLSELGHPLCGEKSYLRLPDGTMFDDRSKAPRQVLHAERLAFTHPLTGERLQFKMPLPADLKSWLSRFKQQ